MSDLWTKVEQAFDETDAECRREHLLLTDAIKRILKACLKIICEHRG